MGEERVGVHFDLRLRVLQFVGGGEGFAGEFPRLPQRNESGAKFERDGRAEDVAARLDGGHAVDSLAAKRLRERANRLAQSVRVGE